MCARPPQASKSVACSENKARKRTKCVHTLLVALALWREGRMGDGELNAAEDISGEAKRENATNRAGLKPR